MKARETLDLKQILPIKACKIKGLKIQELGQNVDICREPLVVPNRPRKCNKYPCGLFFSVVFGFVLFFLQKNTNFKKISFCPFFLHSFFSKWFFLLFHTLAFCEEIPEKNLAIVRQHLTYFVPPSLFCWNAVKQSYGTGLYPLTRQGWATLLILRATWESIQIFECQYCWLKISE